jgi:hypothetical protein
MWMTCLLSAALGLSSGQAGELTLTNVRTTYGILGPERPDNKILPGDNLVLSFDIEGAKIDEQGRLRYSIGMEVIDSKDKVIFRQTPRDVESVVKPEGKRVPACASLRVGMDQPPGEYKLQIAVTDRAGGAAQKIVRTYELLPKSFGIVQVTTTLDQEGTLPAGILQKGKSVWINFSVVGFERAGEQGQPHLKLGMRVLDDAGRSALAQSPSGEIKQNVPAKLQALPGRLELELKQPGKYTVELKATDAIANKTATVTFPVTVANN